MAPPLSWQQVAAPNLSGVSGLLAMASQGFQGATTGLSDALSGLRENQINNRSAAAIPVLAKVANEQGVDAALSAVGGMVRPQDMSPELQKAMLNLRTQAQGYDTTRVNNAVTANADNRAQTTFARRITGEDTQAALAGIAGNAATNAFIGAPVANLPDREILARTIQAEAGNQGYDGMLAVGAVVGNRVKSGKFGQSVRDVALAPGQFSAWNGVTGAAGGQEGQDMLHMQPSADAYKAADAVLSGSYTDPTGGALNYYNPAIANPGWGQQSGGNWTKIGDHVFGTAPGTGGAGSGRPLTVADISALASRPGSGMTPESVVSLIKQVAGMPLEAAKTKQETQNYTDQQTGTLAAQEAIKRAAAVEDVPALITSMNLSPGAERAALAAVPEMAKLGFRQQAFDGTTGFTGTEVDLQNKAQMTMNQNAAQLDTALATNEDARIYKEIQAAQKSTSPAVDMAKELNMTEDSQGRLQQAITEVARQAGVSPAIATAALKETLQRGGVVPDAWIGGIIDGNFSKVHTEIQAAADLAKKYTQPDVINRAQEAYDKVTANMQQLQTLQAQAKGYAQRIQYLRHQAASGGLSPAQQAQLDNFSKAYADTLQFMAGLKTDPAKMNELRGQGNATPPAPPQSSPAGKVSAALQNVLRDPAPAGSIMTFPPAPPAVTVPKDRYPGMVFGGPGF